MARPDPDRRRATRLIHGEADLLPGLVVDRYADCLTVQTLIEATDRRRDLFASLLHETLQPRAIVERNDVKVRAHDQNGNAFTLEAQGLLSVCIQHEMDHLKGKVFVEHLSQLKQQRIRAKLAKQLRKSA